MFILAAAAAFALIPPLEQDGGEAAATTSQPSQQPQTPWTYAEQNNVCTLTRALPGGQWVQIRMTRWRDLSDSILFYRPGLAPLWSDDGHPTGRTEAEDRAEAEAFYRLDIRIDGRPVATLGATNAMILDHAGRPGPTWRFGVRQQPFLRALKRGRTLTLHRAGQPVATVPIAGLAAEARRLAACAAQPVGS